MISVDGPFGSPQYSRRDILDFIPKSLNEEFIIIVDDAQRIGEKNTILEIEEILKKNKISYKKTEYSGESSVCVICSENYHFLCSL